ncbi:MAG TPA: hypothetical protein VGK17_14185 [Propionicimonas sp.]
MGNTSFAAHVAVTSLVLGGLLLYGCTAQSTSAPTTVVVPAASAPTQSTGSAAPTVVVVSGDVTAGGPLKHGDPLPADGEITAVSAAQLKFGSTLVSLKKGTRFSLAVAGLALADGAVRIDDDLDRVVVAAGKLTVSPTGTGFGVALGSAGSTVVIYSGGAQVTGLAADPLNLIAGETLNVAANGTAGALSAKPSKDPFLAAPQAAKPGDGDSSLRALRLAGTYLMKLQVKESNSPDAPPGLKFQRLWTFIPDCAEGACDVAIKRPLLPFTCHTADGCGAKPTFNTGKLPYADGTYSGFLLKGKTTCGTTSGGTRNTKGTFTVSGADFANGAWVVTGISGQIDDRASAVASCKSYQLVTDITGQSSATAPQR